MKKSVLVQKIIARLTEELEHYAAAARASHAEATHEQSRADNKYDTRGLEAAYLARGQSRQVAEVELAIEQFQKLALPNLAEGDPIDLGAYVELTSKPGVSRYFIGPKAGGTEITHDHHEILVITPQSPLGRQLVGKKLGDRLQIEIAGSRSDYRVTKVI